MSHNHFWYRNKNINSINLIFYSITIVVDKHCPPEVTVLVFIMCRAFYFATTLLIVTSPRTAADFKPFDAQDHDIIPNGVTDTKTSPRRNLKRSDDDVSHATSKEERVIIHDLLDGAGQNARLLYEHSNTNSIDDLTKGIIKNEDVAAFAVVKDKRIELLQKKYDDAVDKYQQAVGRLQMAISDYENEHLAANKADEVYQAASELITHHSSQAMIATEDVDRALFAIRAHSYEAAKAAQIAIYDLQLRNIYLAEAAKYEMAIHSVKTAEESQFFIRAHSYALIRANECSEGMEIARKIQNREGDRVLDLRDSIKEKDETIFNHQNEVDNYEMLALNAHAKSKLSKIRARVADQKAKVAQANKDVLLKTIKHAKQELEAARAEKPTHGL
ncbi:hypothetical protein Plhal703r1_c10g0052071 [Plasmopara halstedii]